MPIGRCYQIEGLRAIEVLMAVTLMAERGHSVELAPCLAVRAKSR